MTFSGDEQTGPDLSKKIDFALCLKSLMVIIHRRLMRAMAGGIRPSDKSNCSTQ